MSENAELKLRVEHSGNTRTIHADGELSIMTAGDLRTALIEALQPGVSTVLEASGISAVDLAGLQLVCSAHRTYRTNEASFRFGGASETLRATAAAAGFESRHSSCPYRAGSDCLWKRR